MAEPEPKDREWAERWRNLCHRERERLSEECRKLGPQIAQLREEVRGLERAT